MKKLLKILLFIFRICLISFFILFMCVVFVQKVTNNNFSIGGIRLFNIVSGSMVPKYQIGDVLIINEKDYDEIKIGDDLCYQGVEGEYAGKVVTHQVIDISEDEEGKVFTTQGLANVLADPLVKSKYVYGVVGYKTRVLSFISKLANEKWSFYLCIFIPIGLLVLYWLVEFIKEINQKMTYEAQKLIEKEDQQFKSIEDHDNAIENLKNKINDKKNNK